jgi:glutaminyl-tRNA synthetase
VIEKVNEEAQNERYKFNFLELMPEVKSKFPYLDGKLAKTVLDQEVDVLLRGKNEKELQEIKDREEHETLKKKKKAEKDKFKDAELFAKLGEKLKDYDKEALDRKEISKKIRLSKLDINEQEEKIDEKDKLKSLMARDLKSSMNSEANLKKHLDFTKGKVFTRFPPEPNGYLHIGHAKAMRFDFNSAFQAGGFCYLRYDDTNPEKENQEYITNIEENVKWLGYSPFKITHASDYFEELFQLAIELIKRGKAYVCHQSKEEVSNGRKLMIDSPHRNRSIEENLKLFEMMKQGRFEAKEVK